MHNGARHDLVHHCRGRGTDGAQPAQAVTATGTPTAEQFAALIGELQALRLEVSELRGALLRIEHKPEPDEWGELVAALRK